MNSVTRVFCLGLVAAVCISLLKATPANAQTLSLALVDDTDPGEYRPFVVGAEACLPLNGVHQSWTNIPPDLGNLSLSFYYIDNDPSKTTSVQYGLIHFTVTTSGPVWMLTTSRYGAGGNESGDWIPELTSPDQLVASGWVKLRSDIGIEGGGLAEDDLWQRYSTAGESFSIRTEKYIPPVILQNVPEPSTWALIVLSAVALLSGRRTRRR